MSNRKTVTQHYAQKVWEALNDYAATAPLDLLNAREIQRDLFAIGGAQHVHRASIRSDQCALCKRDLRDEIHKRIGNE